LLVEQSWQSRVRSRHLWISFQCITVRRTDCEIRRVFAKVAEAARDVLDRTTIADATRLLIRLADPTSSWCLLHELAHAMSCTHEGESDGHGRRFMGLYAQLLIRYLRIPADALCKSLHDADIDVDMDTRPVFLDDRPTGRAAVSASLLSRLAPFAVRRAG
jgi:hypothetical protein